MEAARSFSPGTACSASEEGRRKSDKDDFSGNGLCCVTDSANLLALERCFQVPTYNELKEKYHCRLTTEEESKQTESVEDLKALLGEIFRYKLGRCTVTNMKLTLKDNTTPV
ncbi:hypothetical protein OESDEN_09689 [Oesophagostomum dentatum]|uniref:Uncharacterized protein n=1 Tax=Oesophagostomum dentatum TaxID=61180 RepID=A0A0B1SYS6_OESDE|nr:hypothetical protein OESDEN_09689 [Oesophagostomum dentatum]